ncbi:MAG: ATP-binding cassette domain-containing protein [Deltaproteobacteria bacterium]|nr:MAG: ATP-binding cassette domain-containing protein [Deltaproteobacteria bacterium]
MTRFFLFFFCSLSLIAQWEGPMSGGLLGYQIKGADGFFFGTALGILDEVGVAYEVVDHRYFGAALVGASVLKQVDLPYQLNYVLGISFGLNWAYHGMQPLNEYSLSLIEGGISGFCYGENIWWVLFGAGISSTIEGSCISNGFASSLSLVRALNIHNVFLENFLGVMFSNYLYVYKKSKLSQSNNHVRDNIEKILRKLLPERSINLYIEQQTLEVLSSQLFIIKIISNAHPYYTAIWTEPLNMEYSRFYGPLKIYLLYLLAQSTADSLLTVVVTWDRYDFLEALEYKVRQIYLHEEVLSKIASITWSESEMRNLYVHLYDLIDSGIILYSSFLQAQAKLLYNILLLYNLNSIEMLYWIALVEEFGLTLSNIIADECTCKFSLLNQIDTEVAYIQTDLMYKPDSIILGNNILYLQKKINELVIEKKSIERFRRMLLGLQPLVHNFVTNLEYVSKYAFIASTCKRYDNIKLKKLRIIEQQAKISKISNAGYEIALALAWTGRNSADLVKSSLLSKNLQEVFFWIDNPVYSLNLTLSYVPSNIIAIGIQNLTFGVDHKLLGTGINLVIGEEAKRYSLVGENGVGKSTFLKILKGYQDFQLKGEGFLFYFGLRNPKFAMILQDEYFVPYVSLEELIGENLGHFSCKKLKLCRSDWSEKRTDWVKLLSGGEKKKISILKTLLNSADFILLDEVFAPLDLQSSYLCQKFILEQYKESIILSIDHYGQYNNWFYDSSIFIKDKNMTISYR